MENKDKIIEVAKYFISKSEKESENDSSKNLSPLKLQKLVYYAKAWGLAIYKEKIFSDNFEAWIHGPANPKLWQYFRTFNFSEKHPEITSSHFEEISSKEKEVLDIVWNHYGKFDGQYLEALTHSESPWLEARQGLDAITASQNIISDDLIEAYYVRRLEEASRVEQANSI